MDLPISLSGFLDVPVWCSATPTWIRFSFTQHEVSEFSPKCSPYRCLTALSYQDIKHVMDNTEAQVGDCFCRSQAYFHLSQADSKKALLKMMFTGSSVVGNEAFLEKPVFTVCTLRIYEISLSAHLWRIFFYLQGLRFLSTAKLLSIYSSQGNRLGWILVGRVFEQLPASYIQTINWATSWINSLHLILWY